MDIKVLGPGCRNCLTLEKRVREALADANLQADVEKITDYAQILGFGVMATPGLVINGEVVSSGKVPTVRKITELISGASK